MPLPLSAGEFDLVDSPDATSAPSLSDGEFEMVGETPTPKVPSRAEMEKSAPAGGIHTELPTDLKSDAQLAASAPTRVNPRTGRTYRETPPGQSYLDFPLTGTQKIVEGTEALASPLQHAAQDIGALEAARANAVRTGKYDVPQTISGEKDLRDVARGVTKIASGAFDLSTPLLMASGVEAPAGTVISLGAGALSQMATEKALKALDVPEEYAGLAGVIAGAAGASVGAVASYMKNAAFRAMVRRVLQDRLNTEFSQGQRSARQAREAAETGPAATPKLEGQTATPPVEDIQDAETEPVPAAAPADLKPGEFDIVEKPAAAPAPVEAEPVEPAAPAETPKGLTVGAEFQTANGKFTIGKVEGGKITFTKETARGKFPGTLPVDRFTKLVGYTPEPEQTPETPQTPQVQPEAAPETAETATAAAAPEEPIGNQPLIKQVDGTNKISAETPTGGVTSFETAKGSVYTVAGSGTARSKTATGEKFGPSDQTVYLAPDVAQRVMEELQANNIGGSKASVRSVGDGTIAVVVKNRETGEVDNQRSKVIPITSETPAVGLTPVELWHKDQETGEYGFHVGHAITKVSADSEATPTPEASAPESSAKPAEIIPENIPAESGNAETEATEPEAAEPATTQNSPSNEGEKQEVAEPLSAGSRGLVDVKHGTLNEVFPHLYGHIDGLRKQGDSVLDLHRKPTGWLEIQSGDGSGTTLIHPTDDKVIQFRAKDPKSGSDGLRAKAEAQSYAIDNPVTPTQTASEPPAAPAAPAPAPVRRTDSQLVKAAKEHAQSQGDDKAVAEISAMDPKKLKPAQRGFLNTYLDAAKPAATPAQVEEKKPEAEAEAPDTEDEGPSPNVEVQQFRGKGNKHDKIDVYVRNHPGKGWEVEGDFNLQGLGGGHLGDSGYDKFYPTREEALGAFVKDATRPQNALTAQIPTGFSNDKAKARQAAMIRWVEGLAPKPAPEGSKAVTFDPQTDFFDRFKARDTDGRPLPTENNFTYFTGKSSADVAKMARSRSDMGLMISPRLKQYLAHIQHYPVVTIDNGAFYAEPTSAEEFDKFLTDVAAHPEAQKKVFFVVAPDVVGNAKATIEKFPTWEPMIHSHGLPVAFVAQDGVENMLDEIPWDKFEVLFIGGSTEWKIGKFSDPKEMDPQKNLEASRKETQWRALFKAAREHKKTVHFGRVNSYQRAEIVSYGLGEASADGTYLAYGPEKNLPQLTNWLDRLNNQDDSHVPAGAEPKPEDKPSTQVEEPTTPVAAEEPAPAETEPTVEKGANEPAAEPSTAEPEEQRSDAEPEPVALDGEHSPALETVPSDDVQGSGEVGPTGSQPEERPAVNEGSPGRSDREGDAAQPGVGSGEGELGVPPGGERPTTPRREPERANTGTDYRITDADEIGKGTVRHKAGDNLEAIRTLKKIEAEGRLATPEEQKILAKYVGWGGMPQAFAEYNVPREWQGVREELDNLLTKEEFESARASTPNAHYTSPTVVKGMWDALDRLGIARPGAEASILEPSMGAGVFFGLMPDGIEGKRVGVELDSLTGRIASFLYPKADVRVSGFEQTRLPNNYFDVAIGNVPFGNYGIHDPAYKRFPVVTKSIHDYFFAKALDKVRPGGVVAFITSSYTMDKQNSAVRKYLADRADLIGAIRLPNTAFKGNAGTEVTTDIIFLKKRPAQTAPQGETWTELAPFTGTQMRPDGSRGPADMQINEYYTRHPEMMLGQMSLEGTMYAAKSPTLNGDLTPEKLAEAVARLPENATGPIAAEDKPAFNTLANVAEAGDVKQGGYTVKDGVVMVRNGDVLEPAGMSEEQAGRVRGMISVRDAVRKVFKAQIDGLTDANVKAEQKNLGNFYDAFVKKYGFLHERKNAAAFAEDPDAPLLLSLENWDPDKKTATKAAIFTERTLDAHRRVEKADTGKDALSVVLNERGRLDWARMQELTGKTPTELQEELGALIYHNPEDRQWETADAYLSGNVRKKLAGAQDAAAIDKKYERNVEALKAVQPRDLEPHEIHARLGSGWIPKEDIVSFVAQLLGVSERMVSVGHSAALGSWTLQLSNKYTIANTETWGTKHFDGHELIEQALNARNPTAYNPGVGDLPPTVNEKETIAAREVQHRIKEEFSRWVWSDPARAERLSKQYNEDFNNLRMREYDGSHLTFPGMSAGLTLRKHQKNAVWRMLQNGNTLLAHVVGAGKTLEIIAGAMEMRRIGLAKKPLIVVPKNRVDGTAEEWYRAYPAANILTMSSEDFTPKNRQKMMSRIATGNWDGVIVSYESFEKLPISDETFNKYLRKQIKQLEEYIRQSKADRNDTKIVKELEKAKKRLEAKLRNKKEGIARDNTVNFEDLGGDALFVDEADNFKNLFFPTKMTRIAGIPNTESKRAFDMYIKSQYVAERNGGQRGIIFATGTPIANTMAEMFTMQRYLQPQWLEEHGLSHFDSWAQTFGEVRPTLETTPDATGVRTVNKFSSFINIPELAYAFRLVADVQTADMLKLPVPSLKGGKPKVIAAQASPAQKAYLKYLAARAKDIRDKKVKPEEDNMLKVSTDGRKAGLDIRLVDPSAEESKNSKTSLLADEVHRIWKETAAKKLTQLVFLDFSRPAMKGESRFSVSDDIKAKLIARGIPASDIAFIHDAEKDAQKEKLFRDVNNGKTRVLIGSTQKMGVGLNVQRLLYAAHDVDAPWRPRDIEQRHGRILRQGNTNSEVEIYTYVTEPSFDARMWDILRGKAAFISQVMSGDPSMRTAEDISEVALNFAEVSAIASGNPIIREKALVDTEVRKLDAMRSRHESQQIRARSGVAQIPLSIESAKRSLAAAEKDIATREANEPAFKIGKQVFAGEGRRKGADEAIDAIREKHRGDVTLIRGHEGFTPKTIGEYRGFKIQLEYEGVPKTEGETVSMPSIVLLGQKKYYTSNSAASIEATINGQPDALRTRAAEDIETDEKTLADLKKTVGQPFEEQEKLKAALRRQAELEALLAAPPEPEAIAGDEGASESGEDEDPEDGDTAVGRREANPSEPAEKPKPAAKSKASKGAGPIADYKPENEEIPPPLHGWYHFEKDGQSYYSNGHFILEGKAPEGDTLRAEPTDMTKFLAEPENAKEIKPQAYSKGAKRNDPRLVWFGKYSAVDADYYDYIRTHVPEAKFFIGSNPEQITIKSAGRVAGVIMGMGKRVLEKVPDAVLRVLNTSTFGPETGSAPMIMDFAQWLADKFGPAEGPKANYSGLGGLKRIFLPGRNLEQVKQASKPVYTAALAAGSSQSQATVILFNAMPAIRDALKGSNRDINQLMLAYVESRLRGLKERWEHFADEALNESDESLQKSIYASSGDGVSAHLGLLGSIEGRHGIAQNLAQTAAAIAEDGDWETLRGFLNQAYTDAADRVINVMEPDEFDAISDEIADDPKVKRAHEIYKDLVESELSRSHALNEGVFSDALGPLNTYYPLMAPGHETAHPPGRRLPFTKPKNLHSAFATGIATDYTTDMAEFAKSLSASLRANDKAKLVSTMLETGWAAKEPEGWDGGFLGPDNVMYQGVREESAPGRTIVKSGKAIHVPARFVVMPKFMGDGLRLVLGRQPMDGNDVAKAVQWLNMLATKGPLELFYHSAGLMGALNSNTPFLGKSGLDKVLSAPIAKWFAIRGKLAMIDPTTPENVAKLQRIARVGALPSKSGKVTYSKEIAETTGAEHERFSFTPMLYGPKGMDARGRILMYDIALAANPKITDAELSEFINELGNYTPEFQGAVERAVKRIGVGPFATAGMTRLMNGVHASIGNGPMPKSGWKLRLQQQLSGGLLISLALWVIAYKELTGKWPSQDIRAKLWAFPVGHGDGVLDKFRHSKLGDALWGKDDSKVGYLNFSMFNPLVARVTPKTAYTTAHAGGTTGQIVDATQKDVMNTLAHPALGPAARAAFVGLTSQEPYITGLRERSGRPGLKLLPATPDKLKPGFMGGFAPSLASGTPRKNPGWSAQQGARASATLKELNSLGGEIGEVTGFLGADHGQPGNAILRTVFDLAFPGLIGTAGNPFAAQTAIRQQKTGTQ